MDSVLKQKSKLISFPPNYEYSFIEFYKGQAFLTRNTK